MASHRTQVSPTSAPARRRMPGGPGGDHAAPALGLALPAVAPPQAVRAQAAQPAQTAQPAQPAQSAQARPARHDGLPAALQQRFEQLSGIDLGDVQVHRGSSMPARFGALALTQGHQIHLARGQEAHLAHEAWHVVQQKQGRVPARAPLGRGGVPFNTSPALEAEAHRMGEQAARSMPSGQAASARAQLRVVPPAAQPVAQRFVEAGAGKWRVADDGKMLVSQENGIYGGRRFYADGALITGSESVLKAQKSALSLASGAGTISVQMPDGSPALTLSRVVPTNRNDGSTGNDRKTGMQWPEDCGLAANTVMQGGGRKTRAVYTKPDPPEPGFFAKILAAVAAKFGDTPPVAAKGGPRETGTVHYGTVYQTYRGRKFYSPHKMLDDVFADAMEKGPDAAWAAYRKLGAKERDAFDREVGINRYASPEVGEAFSIVANKDENIDMGVWNFHWGGVVMKSGGDLVTMENFAGSGTDAWDFQMYGPPSKAGQTFHEQQESRTKRDGITPEYGNNPTTLRVRAVP